MKTLGIDLAAQDIKTAACLVNWSSGKAEVVALEGDQSNDQLKDLARQATWTGIDVPFGWPAAALEAVAAYGEHGRWTSKVATEDLRLRKTDRLVRERVGIVPLSVSSDRIAITAWRGAQLLTQLSGPHKVERIGLRGLVEVYPAAALKLWDFDRRGYKNSRRKANLEAETNKRRELLEQIEQRAAAAGWVTAFPAQVREACQGSDDVLDAFICALIARAASVGQTAWPEPDWLELAEVEGWIHLPLPGSFAQLGDGRPLIPPVKKSAQVPTWPDDAPRA